MTDEILGASLAELRSTRSSMKWRAYGPDVIPLWVAEMDASQCPAVIEEVTDALRRGDTGYAHSAPLIEAFIEFAADRWEWSVQASQVFQVPDVMIGVEELIQAHVASDGAVVLSPPCYDSFPGFVAATRRRLVEAPLGDDLRLDPAALERAFVEAGPGSMYVLCNPQNPTGTVHTRDELQMLASLAAAHGVLVVSDEIHAPLVFAGVEFTPYLSVLGSERGLALVSGSKAWNLAGLKTALLVAGAEAEHGLHEVVTHGAQHLAVLAQTAAYREGRDWLDQLVGEIADRRAWLITLLAERLPGVVVRPAEATYLAWLDCSALGLNNPATTFLSRGVAVVPGTRYDRHAEQYVRLNMATSREVLTEAVRRMAG